MRLGLTWRIEKSKWHNLHRKGLVIFGGVMKEICNLIKHFFVWSKYKLHLLKLLVPVITAFNFHTWMCGLKPSLLWGY